MKGLSRIEVKCVPSVHLKVRTGRPSVFSSRAVPEQRHKEVHPLSPFTSPQAV